MKSIEGIANDPGWQPSSHEPIANLPIRISTPIGRGREIRDLIVVVRALENGLLYAVPVDKLENNGPIFARSYPVENFPKGQSPYQLINLKRTEREGVPGFAATFEYKAGKTPEGLGEAIPNGLDEARIEYTAWHNPVDSLTLLTSVQAHQAVKEGWIDLSLNIPTYGNSDRAMTMKISFLDENLGFDKNGNLEKQVKRLFWSSKELEGIYQAVIKGAQTDPLKTAVVLINGFPSQRPLHLEQFIQYKLPT